MPKKTHRGDVLWLLVLTLAAVLLHGYHLGTEDQAIYLPAIQRLLDPAFCPHYAEFFLQQPQFTLFPALMAATSRTLHAPLDAVMFAWWLLTIFLLLLGALQISRRCFSDPAAQWAGVATIVALLSLPVTNTGVQILEQYLHPRGMATAALLFALTTALDRRPRALAWLALAAAIHPTMAFFGAVHIFFLTWTAPQRHLPTLPALLLAPQLSNPAWKEALYSRRFLWPLQWHWHEWLGVIGPLALLGWFSRLGKRNANVQLAHVSARLLLSGSFGVATAIVITSAPGLERFAVFEPMRVLHLLYFLFFLLAGGLAGQYWLRNRPVRWALLFVPLCGVMLYASHRQFPASPQIEWPGSVARNDWVEAFDWVRQNTPRDALFALDPVYMDRPGEDQHAFSALAERSMLADYTKGRGVAAQFPELAYEWRAQVHDRDNWSKFQPEDFRRLKRKYGVTWVVLERPGVPGISDCPFSNDRVMVCRIE
jgi:hypothetical protein